MKRRIKDEYSDELKEFLRNESLSHWIKRNLLAREESVFMILWIIANLIGIILFFFIPGSFKWIPYILFNLVNLICGFISGVWLGDDV